MKEYTDGKKRNETGDFGCKTPVFSCVMQNKNVCS
jgi:hypothetical protein